MKSKTLFQFLFVAVLFSGVGCFISQQFVLDEEKAESSYDASFQALRTANARLKSELARAKRRISLLEEDQNLAKRKKGPKSSSLLPKTSELSSASTAIVGSNQVVAMSQTIARLEKDLEAARKKLRPLSDEEMAEKVAEIKTKFESAIFDGQGKAALAAMKELSKLDSRAYPALLGLWNTMREKEWMGLGKRESRSWLSTDLMHWALNTENLGVDKKTTGRIQALSLKALRKMESNPEKLAGSYVAFLDRLGDPKERVKEGEKGQKKKQRDSYRLALRELARVEDSQSTVYLTGVLNNNSYPSDVRLTALKGLTRQGDSSDEAFKAIEDAQYDSDPRIKNYAVLAKQQLNAPVPGVFITKVSGKGQGKKLGIAVGGIIVSYNGKTIRNNGDLKKQRKRAKGEFSTIRVQINGQVQTYKVKNNGDLGLAGNSVRGPKK